MILICKYMWVFLSLFKKKEKKKKEKEISQL